MRAWTIAASPTANQNAIGADLPTRRFTARKTMKMFGLLLMFGLMAMMTAMLSAMAAEATARLSFADQPRLVARTVSATDPSSAAATAADPTQLATPTPATETSHKRLRRRSLATCARVTSTCWRNA